MSKSWVLKFKGSPRESGFILNPAGDTFGTSKYQAQIDLYFPTLTREQVLLASKSSTYSLIIKPDGSILDLEYKLNRINITINGKALTSEFRFQTNTMYKISFTPRPNQVWQWGYIGCDWYDRYSYYKPTEAYILGFALQDEDPVNNVVFKAVISSDTKPTSTTLTNLASGSQYPEIQILNGSWTEVESPAVFEIEGPADIKTRGWKTFRVVNPPYTPKTYQWSTSQSFKYAEENGPEFKFYIEGNEHFERDPYIFCNIVMSCNEDECSPQISLMRQLSATSAPQPSIEAAQAVISGVPASGVATSLNVAVNASKSLSKNGAKFKWIVDTDQLTTATYTGESTTIGLGSLINKGDYSIDGKRGYINVNITLEMYRGCLVSTAQTNLVVPDSLLFP